MFKTFQQLVDAAVILCAVLLASSFSMELLRIYGLKAVLVFCVLIFAGALIWISKYLASKGKLDTSKIVIFILIFVGTIMSAASYYLAYIGRSEIAENLSKAALVELVAPAVIFLLKSLVENLSINNNWPDKPEDNSTTSI